VVVGQLIHDRYGNLETKEGAESEKREKKESGAGTMVSRSGALGTGSPKRVAGSRVGHSQGIV
jgi:hypothetical protein